MARHLDESKWMKVGSLCTGSGGLDLAVKAFWPEAEFIWFAENDKDCTKVLAHHWPNVPNLGDLTKIDWHQVERPDLLVGGYPCQPYSVAGSRLGDSDERAIFSYIADACRVLSPGRLFFENVSGHTSLGGPSVIGAITGLGYDCRWGVVSAAEAKAPHLRRRWFLVAHFPDACGERYGKREIGRGVGLLDSRDEGEARQRQRARQEFVNRGAAPAAHADSPGRGEQCGSVPVEPEQRPAERGRSETQWQQFTPAIERWERTIGRPAPAPTDDGKLSSRFVEWMMGLPDGHVCGVGLTSTAELKMLGTAVVPAQAHLALELLHHDT